MKNSFLKIMSLTSVLAIAAASAFAGGNIAQETKGAALLMKPAAATAVSAPTMNCPKCKDATVTKTANEKGQLKSTYTVTKHLCPTCEQKVITTGVGKNAQTIMKHSCGEAGGCVAQK